MLNSYTKVGGIYCYRRLDGLKTWMILQEATSPPLMLLSPCLQIASIFPLLLRNNPMLLFAWKMLFYLQSFPQVDFPNGEM